MVNMNPHKTKMKEQEPQIRNHNFLEVTLGYTEEEAIEEATRCLNCKHKPCVGGCPVAIRIPEFIQKVVEKDFEAAYQIIHTSSSLPAVCGRVCPQEHQCEGPCVRGIKAEPVAIGRLERFVADWHRQYGNHETKKAKPIHRQVAIVGAGPAGLACASDLIQKGYAVTIFEALHVAGGVLMYGIPEFRLPKSIVDYEINHLKDLGVHIETNVVIGKTKSIQDLFDEGYEAIFVGSGAGLPNFMNIEGENLNGVYSANEYLTRCNLMKAYKKDADTPMLDFEKIAIIGGGNVAMDAARCAKRLGAKEVSIVYRRGEEELPARLEEIHHAKEEGIQFRLLTNPLRIKGNEQGWVTSMECVQMELKEADDSGRKRPVAIANSNFDLLVDAVIMSIGTSPNPLLSATTKHLEVNTRGCLIVDENHMTTHEHVYAGGDAVTGAATVILAMGAGKKAAVAIDEHLQKKDEI